VSRALVDIEISGLIGDDPLTLVSAGKAAVPMATTFCDRWQGELRGGVIAAPVKAYSEDRLEFFSVGHPVPTQASADAALRVLEVAGSVGPSDTLVVLLSGGASASLAAPVDRLTLGDKVKATEALLRGGVAIDGINCVRKHLSVIKGGWLAVATRGRVVTLAISDVVGPVADDPTVIGSGPTTADPTNFEDAIRIADHPQVRPYFPATARSVLEEGRRGVYAETPKPGDPRLAKSSLRVIGGRRDAMQSAATQATALGFAVGVIDTPVIGEARYVADSYFNQVIDVASRLSRPACVVSTGETTVEVRGLGRGGRNQELGLALVDRLAEMEEDVIFASVGTDGIDGPTDAAGAVVNKTTRRRAQTRGLGTPATWLDNNDSYAFFEALGDLVTTGPTDTNVGDLQVFLLPGK